MINDDRESPVPVPVSTILVQQEAEELLRSPEAQSYRRLAEAVVAGRDTGPALREISLLPLEKRYLWRAVSALRWAFVDLEDLYIEADTETLPPEDLKKVVSLVRLRPMQFCLFLSALFGPSREDGADYDRGYRAGEERRHKNRVTLAQIRTRRAGADLSGLAAVVVHGHARQRSLAHLAGRE